MDTNNDPLTCKEMFLQEHPFFSEIELTDESKPIGKLDGFNLKENEIWLMQCPKYMDITELQNQKLKIPGRFNINSSESVSMEFDDSKKRHAFAYCNRKGRYALRLLPVRGTIVLRDRLKAAKTITEERAEECVCPAKRVPMPKSIRIRHPLLGFKYEDKVKLDKSIEERLQKADDNTAQILKKALNQKSKKKLEVGFKKILQAAKVEIEINSADDDVQFVSEEKLKKKKKNKRKQSEASEATTHSVETPKLKKSKKSILNEKELVSKDLQWLQTI